MRFDCVVPYVATKVSAETFETQDPIGLYVTDYKSESFPLPLQISGNRANNVRTTYDGTAWIPDNTIYWGESKANVYAYYPYVDNIIDVDAQPFSVAADQNEEDSYENSDVLWAKAEAVSQGDGVVQLEMKHLMSRLVVKIVAGEDYVGSLPSNATVHLHNTVADAHIALATGAVTKDPYAGAKSIKMKNCGIQASSEGKAVIYEVIVVPQMLQSIVPLLEINSKSVSYLLEDSFNFKQGISYTYTIVLNTSTTGIKIDIGCSTDDWNNMGSGPDDGEGDSDSGEYVDLSLYTDLSADGAANCYLVKANGNYKFKAVQGNSLYSVGNVKNTKVLWETFGTDLRPNEGDLIASTGFQDGYIYFSTAENFSNGNASIAASNSKGVILWSWHIWCSEEGWIDHVYSNDAGIMMDRNLGATSAIPGDVGALGLLYQWGRKEPFVGSCSISSNVLASSTGNWNNISGSVYVTMQYSESHPTTHIDGWNGGDLTYTWRMSAYEKGLYDPCPVGYRVPDGGENGFWVLASANTVISTDWTNHGITWVLSDMETTAWYPQVGCRKPELYEVGTYGRYWTAYAENSQHLTSNVLHFAGSVYPLYTSNRSDASVVRCVKDLSEK